MNAVLLLDIKRFSNTVSELIVMLASAAVNLSVLLVSLPVPVFVSPQIVAQTAFEASV